MSRKVRHNFRLIRAPILLARVMLYIDAVHERLVFFYTSRFLRFVLTSQSIAIAPLHSDIVKARKVLFQLRLLLALV